MEGRAGNIHSGDNKVDSGLGDGVIELDVGFLADGVLDDGVLAGVLLVEVDDGTTGLGALAGLGNEELEEGIQRDRRDRSR